MPVCYKGYKYKKSPLLLTDIYCPGNTYINIIKHGKSHHWELGNIYKDQTYIGNIFCMNMHEYVHILKYKLNF